MAKKKTKRVALLVCFVVLGSPVWGQDKSEKSLEEMIEELKSQDEGVRESAADLLRDMGPKAAPAILALVEALGDESEDVRSSASWALAEIGPPAIPALVEAIGQEKRVIRYHAADALQAIDDSQAAGPLRDMGPRAVPALLRALHDTEELVSDVASASLARVGPPAVLGLIETLGDEDGHVRELAARTLANMGSEAAPAIPALIETFHYDEDKDVRMTAGCALGGMGSLGHQATPAVLALIEWQRQRTATTAPWVFEEIDPRAEALEEIQIELKKQGTLLWWIVPRVYWKEIIALLLLLAAWFALAARFPRHRPAGRPKQAALLLLAASIPSGLACSAVGHALTRDWAQDFLPNSFLVLFPFHVSAVLSVGFCCVLAAVWACQRRPVGEDETAPGGEA